MLLVRQQRFYRWYMKKLCQQQKKWSLYLNMIAKMTMNVTALPSSNAMLKVKGLDVSLLKKFLIFCTGSDIINVSKIEITFTMPESEYARQPVAHTCGPVLELPCTYHNFPELRSEFSNILKCSYWEMDIV